jgi:7,8-dihydropterin-6-yl-methyl-4-(beta-D-ribofuranosyl)aminobenzene 5'-phosphate synthase
MKITCLIEDTSCFSEYDKESGLSLYISTDSENILFDFGIEDKFLKNARKLPVDIKGVDKAFISHGHYDHGGGAGAFLEANADTPIYIQKSAFGKYYARIKGNLKYGGFDQDLAHNPRFVNLEGTTKIGEDLHIISDVHPKNTVESLLMEKDGEIIPDTFEHEQSLVISENGKKTLISGCSHCGIDHILAKAQEICGKIDFLIGGFHLISYDFSNSNDLAVIDTLARNLLSEGVMCYTCHCTSTKGYVRLKNIMGDNISYLSTGTTIKI